MRKVGTIREIWRYPVKGMAGESLRECALQSGGLSGDRIWALRDTLRREIQSCKFRPELLLCNARCRDGNTGAATPVDVLFPDGATIGSDDAAIHARLSALVGHESTLEPLRPASDLAFYRRYKPDDHSWLRELEATFEREPGEPLPDFRSAPPEAFDFIAAPGSFFLVTPFHMITTATLARLRDLNPESDWDARRFRPNVLIESEPGVEGLREQAWIGAKLSLGETRVDCVGSTPRCGAITRAQREFGPDKKILRTVVQKANQDVGVYGTIAAPGRLRVGDSVYVHDR